MHNAHTSDPARDDTYICSEYVWECFHAAGIDIAHDVRGFIAPRDFADDPAIHGLYRLGHNPATVDSAR
jgi:uncharacterized protein YycO